MKRQRGWRLLDRGGDGEERGCGCIVKVMRRMRNKREREELEKMGKKNKTCFFRVGFYGWRGVLGE